MARPESTIDLGGPDKRDMIALIQSGPSPEKYRFVRFEDKRDVERV